MRAARAKTELLTLILGAAVLAGQLSQSSAEHRHPAGVRTAIELATKRQKVATTVFQPAVEHEDIPWHQRLNTSEDWRA